MELRGKNDDAREVETTIDDANSSILGYIGDEQQVIAVTKVANMLRAERQFFDLLFPRSQK